MLADSGWNGRRLACGGFLLAWLFYFNRDVLALRFAPDDMMNMAYYFRAGTWRIVASLVTPWTGFYRPMGGAFYMLLFHRFGLDPAAYHAAILLLLAGAAGLVYRFAQVVGAPDSAAFLAALVFCYHPGMSNLYYNSGFVYDVLCLFFYLAAFICYATWEQADWKPGTTVAGRGVGEQPPVAAGTPRSRILFLLLFLCALDSKEMAVTLPPVLALYDWMYRRQKPGWILAAAGAIDAAYIWSRVFGPGALISQPGYGPVVSARRLVDFQHMMVSDIFLSWHYSAWPVWALLAYLAWSRRRTVMRFCWLFAIVLAPLPIEFLQGRGAACLAIPGVGLAVLASAILLDVAWTASHYLASEPPFRRIDRRTLAAAVVAVGIVLWAHRIYYLKGWYVQPAMVALGKSGWEVIGQFRALHPRVRPGSQVVFLHDPSTDLETASIAQLWFDDPSIAIHLQRQNPMTPEELDHMDCLFDFQDGKLVRVR